MRKTTAAWTIAILGFMIGLGTAGYTQDAAQAKSSTEARAQPGVDTTEKPVHAYRLDFSVNELEDGKKINTRQYSLNLNADDANEIKIGTRVPIESKQGEFQYLDVGTNIWCRIGERSGRHPAERTRRDQQFRHSRAAGRPRRPVLYYGNSRSTPALWLCLGKPMVVGSVDDPNSKRQFQLEVTVSKLR